MACIGALKQQAIIQSNAEKIHDAIWNHWATMS